jgi:hypothetical protein
LVDEVSLCVPVNSRERLLASLIGAPSKRTRLTSNYVIIINRKFLLSLIAGKDMASTKALQARREIAIDTIERWCRP